MPLWVAEKKGEDPIPHFFKEAQWHVALPPVSYAWDTTNTTTPNVMPPSSGMGERPVYEGTNVGGLSSLMDYHFVSASRPWQGAQTHPTPLDTSARGVESQDIDMG